MRASQDMLLLNLIKSSCDRITNRSRSINNTNVRKNKTVSEWKLDFLNLFLRGSVMCCSRLGPWRHHSTRAMQRTRVHCVLNRLCRHNLQQNTHIHTSLNLRCDACKLLAYFEPCVVDTEEDVWRKMLESTSRIDKSCGFSGDKGVLSSKAHLHWIRRDRNIWNRP